LNSNRFTRVAPLTSLQLLSTGAGIFPYPLSWDTVESVCKSSHTDALFAPELFDAETKLNVGANSSSIGTILRSISAVETTVNMNTTVKIGWRMYDPSTRTILDEYVITRDISFSANALNPATAVTSGLERKEAIKKWEIWPDRLMQIGYCPIGSVSPGTFSLDATMGS
jgi:hypothetical protein